MNEQVIESAGNVFTDLGFDDAEATVLQMRARLLNDLLDQVEDSPLARYELRDQLGISERRLRALENGDWQAFSLESLITLESKIGRKVTLQFA